MNHFELLQRFPDDRAIIDYFVQCRYGKHIRCNHCKSNRISPLKNPKFYQCNGCNLTFSIFKGTIFEKTRVSLRKWILAINFVCNNKKSLSACQLQREIGGSYETSWRMLHQIRKAMDSKLNQKLFEAIVEVDETYVGGKPRKGSRKNKPVKRGRGTNKTPVVGILERESGRVYAQVAIPNLEGKKLTGKQLLNIIDKAITKNITIMTDEFKGYKILDKNPERIHLVIDHSKEFVRGAIHTNNIENFWSLLKRGIIGSYHHISVKYMQRYVDEFAFRYGNRKSKDLFELIVFRAVL
ncbi:transposase [Leptospira interrogans serovar Ricardi]|uniref:IS1595 family transposase n=1 Tax=Leptospira interrogans TaxID=173 RepID=UPI0021591334|nr:IS1595 family transposase [Leptospira interrogans]MCR8640779.1 transposase [Leptospira interrogans serovar Ricardi]